MGSISRVRMNTALKKNVVPYLREHGFKGPFPHFRRRQEHHIDLITFQFNRYGGSFVVELAICDKNGVTMDWGEEIPPNKVTAYHVNERYRLRDYSLEEWDHWFDFEKAQNEEDFELVALKVWSLLNVTDFNWITCLIEKEFEYDM